MKIRIPIPETVTENKPIYRAYAMMALNNINTVENYIKKKEEIENIYSGTIAIEKQENVKEKLCESFPFLQVMAEIKRGANEEQPYIKLSDIQTVLCYASELLNIYRNYTTHYYHEDKFEKGTLDEVEPKLVKWINELYTVALRETKARYNYTEDDLKFIQSKRYITKRVGKERKTELNLDFFLSMLWQEKTNEAGKSSKHLSAVGIAQLICLFLEKQYVNIFLSKLPIYGDWSKNSEQARIVRRSIGFYCAKLPKERIHSNKDTQAVALDMLNELKRCPKELFETLSPEDQNRFRTAETEEEEVLLMRHNDRFAQLALQYIDTNELFENIRFHANMGKLRFLFNDNKTFIDGQTGVRVLEHPINAFGRLADLEAERTKADNIFASRGVKIRKQEDIKRDDAAPNSYPYIVDTYTNYIIRNNKIEIRFKDLDNPNDGIPKIEQKEGKHYVRNLKPHCRLSVLELPAMMFHLYLCGKDETETLIRSVYNKYKALFAKMKEGIISKEDLEKACIEEADVPKKILEAINGNGAQKSYADFVKRTLDELLEETKRLKKRLHDSRESIKSEDNKLGKRGFVRIKSGELADFLADDIVKFQRSEKEGEEYGRDKLTGGNYQRLQAALATYNNDTPLSNLRQLLLNANLIKTNSNGTHPFLYDVLSKEPKNAVVFYGVYLAERQKYIEKLQKRFSKNPNFEIPFINKNKNKWRERNEEYYKSIGAIYHDDTPIELPRQMFDKAIRKEVMTKLGGCLKDKFKDRKNDFEEGNITYLIGEYLKVVCEDDFQEFYSFCRRYRYIDILKGETTDKGKIKNVFTTVEEREKLWENRANAIIDNRSLVEKEESKDLSDKDFVLLFNKSRNTFQHTEKIIRRFKVQDALLFLIAKKSLFGDNDTESKKFKLGDIAPDSEKGILSEQMPIDFSFKFTSKGEKITIHADSIKIKNYGDFYKIANDKRFKPLVERLSLKEFNINDIKEELKGYENSRIKFSKLAYDFEKWAFEKAILDKSKAGSEGYLEFSELLNQLGEKGVFKDDEKDKLLEIRNTFSHDDYPPKEYLSGKSIPEIASGLIADFEGIMENCKARKA